jgi:hypothetical protein
MATLDKDRLLEVLWRMDIDVNMYLSGMLPPSTLIPRILEACRKIRQKAIDETAEHQIADLERAVEELSRSTWLSGAPERQRLPGPDESQLMKGLFELRAQLQKTRGSVH